MTTAVDTNVLIDVLLPDLEWAESSRRALEDALDDGDVIFSEPVLAELAPRFESQVQMAAFLSDFGLTFVRSTTHTLFRAGSVWREYAARRPSTISCARCGNTMRIACSACGERISSRQHLMTDFLIGAHALLQADRLLTRDRGYYGTYFPDLVLV